MSRQDDFRQRAQSIESLLSRLENAAEPAVKTIAESLLKSLMDFHRAGLERFLEIVQETGEPGRAVIERLGQDEVAGSLLLLYDLHPLEMRERIAQALEGMRTSLASSNARAELASIDNDGVVTIEFHAQSKGCGSSGSSLKSHVETVVQNAAPDATAIHIKDTSLSASGSAFVPLANLLPADGAAALSGSPQAGNRRVL